MWEETELFHALSSLDLHRRVVSLGIDGTTNYSSTYDFTPAAGGDSPSSASPLGINYDKFFLRAVLWRVYLRILPIPYTGTSLDRITESWLSTLYTQRAYYTGIKQKWTECYKHFQQLAAYDEDAFSCDLGKSTGAGAAFRGSQGRSGSGGGTAPPDNSEVATESPDAKGSTASNVISNFRSSFRSSVRVQQRVLQRKSSMQHNLRDTQIGKGQSPLDGMDSIRDDIIALDIKRTYLNNDPDVPHTSLFTILALWRWQNPTVGYQQGMHELAGNCLMMLRRAAVGAPGRCPPELLDCANPTFFECDAYMLFDRIMNTFGLAELFRASSVVGATKLSASPLVALGDASAPSIGKPSSTKGFRDSLPRAGSSSPRSAASAPATPGGASQFTRRQSDDDDDISAFDSLFNTGEPMTTLEHMCEDIVFHYLKDNSRALYHHLAHTNMFEQLLVFLPRWVRNLFTRELSGSQVFVVWDGLFAIHYHEAVEKSVRMERLQQMSADTKPGRLLGQQAGDAAAMLGPNMAQLHMGAGVSNVMYAGAASSSSPMMGRNTHQLSTAVYSRTVAGIAVCILLMLEDDLLAEEDDFVLLKRLTSTPLLQPTVDPTALLSRAMTIAKTRPQGVLIGTDRKRFGIVGLGGGPPSASADIPQDTTTRLTRDELLLQQRSVALVINNISQRLGTVLRIPADSLLQPMQPATLTADEVSTAAAALRELQYIVRKLSSA
jgi:hypothetical protein